MSNFVSFLFGTVVGAYVSQNYYIPDVKYTLKELVKKLEDSEKTTPKS